MDDAEPGVEHMLGVVEEPCGLGPRLDAGLTMLYLSVVVDHSVSKCGS